MTNLEKIAALKQVKHEKIKKEYILRRDFQKFWDSKCQVLIDGPDWDIGDIQLTFIGSANYKIRVHSLQQEWKIQNHDGDPWEGSIDDLPLLEAALTKFLRE